MSTAKLFWSKMKWVFMLILALVVVGSAIFLVTHRTVPAKVPTHIAGASQKNSPSQSSPSGSTCSTLLPQEPPPEFATVDFKTDFSKHCVHYSEIFSGGPPKDGIPAIDAPRFVRVSQATSWLKPNEPVIFFQVGDDARAYPIQILIWHEIVNDTVGGAPVAVTFCPLCNTAIAFERTVKGRVLDFGTTGRLRFSNLIMYDHQTESWWQQAIGQAIVGQLTGTQLVSRPAAIIAWAAFKAAHPGGQVLSRDTGYDRPYGQNPYQGYDNVNQSPFLYNGPPIPGVLRPMARVLIVVLGSEAVAYPFDALKKAHVVNDTVGKTNIVVLWTSGTSSPLDTSTVAGGRDVGSATVYMRTLDSQHLTFKFDGTNIVDKETGSIWDILGRATSGQLTGKALTPVVAVNSFWFAWAAYQPHTRVYQPGLATANASSLTSSGISRRWAPSRGSKR
jgi:hypothetical protein